METAGLFMVLNHCIAASNGVSEGESWTQSHVHGISVT